MELSTPSSTWTMTVELRVVLSWITNDEPSLVLPHCDAIASAVAGHFHANINTNTPRQHVAASDPPHFTVNKNKDTRNLQQCQWPTITIPL